MASSARAQVIGRTALRPTSRERNSRKLQAGSSEKRSNLCQRLSKRAALLTAILAMALRITKLRCITTVEGQYYMVQRENWGKESRRESQDGKTP